VFECGSTSPSDGEQSPSSEQVNEEEEETKEEISETIEIVEIDGSEPENTPEPTKTPEIPVDDVEETNVTNTIPEETNVLTVEKTETVEEVTENGTEKKE
jgi:hypothetical protein